MLVFLTCFFQRQAPLHRRVQDAPGHGPALGLRQALPREDGLQEAHQDEHANGPGGEGKKNWTILGFFI